MQKDRVTIQFCGFGGQGIILSSVIFGTTAVLHSGMNAVQTQSYGSESRGGECQAELILSHKPIISPLADKLDILVAMSQPALNQYLKRLKPGGTLIIDPEYVTQPDRTDILVISIPATMVAGSWGRKLWPICSFLVSFNSLTASGYQRRSVRGDQPECAFEIPGDESIGSTQGDGSGEGIKFKGGGLAHAAFRISGETTFCRKRYSRSRGYIGQIPG